MRVACGKVLDSDCEGVYYSKTGSGETTLAKHRPGMAQPASGNGRHTGKADHDGTGAVDIDLSRRLDNKAKTDAVSFLLSRTPYNQLLKRRVLRHRGKPD